MKTEVFNLPSSTLDLELKNDLERLFSINFGCGGKSITYAFEYTNLDIQVDQLETLYEKNMLTKPHLRCEQLSDFNQCLRQ